MKVLNLDKLAAKEQRYLAIAGVRHKIAEMTVSNFIETTAAAVRIADAPLVDQVKATIEMVMRSVPSASEAELHGLPLETLQVIVAFVRGDSDVEGVEASEEGEDGKK